MHILKQASSVRGTWMLMANCCLNQDETRQLKKFIVIFSGVRSGIWFANESTMLWWRRWTRFDWIQWGLTLYPKCEWLPPDRPAWGADNRTAGDRWPLIGYSGSDLWAISEYIAAALPTSDDSWFLTYLESDQKHINGQLSMVFGDSLGPSGRPHGSHHFAVSLIDHSLDGCAYHVDSPHGRPCFLTTPLELRATRFDLPHGRPQFVTTTWNWKPHGKVFPKMLSTTCRAMVCDGHWVRSTTLCVLL